MSDECKRCGVTWHPRRLYAECPKCAADREIQTLRDEVDEAEAKARFYAEIQGTLAAAREDGT